MNKHLNGLVALGTIAAMSVTMAPVIASANTSQTPAEVKAIAENNLENFVPTNDTEESDILDCASQFTTGAAVTASNFLLTPASEATEGSVSAVLRFSDGVNTETYNYSSTIAKLEATTSTTSAAVIVNESDFQFDVSTGTITKYTGSETEVVIPSEINGVSVTSIDAYAFTNCSNLISITIPSSVTSIVVDTFSACSSLEEISVSNENENYKSIDGVLYNKAGNEILHYPIGKKEANYIIPNSVTSIGWTAFEGSSNLKNIIIPNSVTDIGWKAFGNCSALTSIVIPNTVNSIPYNAFRECSSLTSVTIPNSVTSIGYYAFDYCENAIFYVESQEVKQLLINVGVDESKIILNDQSSTGDEVLRQKLDDAVTLTQIANDTTETSFIKSLQSNLSVETVTVSLDSYQKVDATDTNDGYIHAVIRGTRSDNSCVTIEIEKPIYTIPSDNYVIAPALEAAWKGSDVFLGQYKYTNSTTQKDIEAYIASKVNNTGINVVVSNFSLVPATYLTQGSCKFNADFITADGDHADNDFETDIPKLVATNTSSVGSSGGSGSSSSRASSSTSAATSTGTATTTIQSILTGNGTAPVNKDTIAKAIATIGVNNTVDPTVAKEISKEVAKFVTANIVSDLSATIGQGVIADAAKEVTTADGNTLSVATLTKDGTSLGAVITAVKDSTISTIPVYTTSGDITAVYKFVPLLGKYIQITDGITIGTNVVTLPTQANTTYVAVANQLASTDTVTQGWTQVNNNWYMLNKTGDPQTGWQKDSTGWVYLSPSNAAMQTGWNKQGDTWYKLGPNGYMQTGWVKDNNNWYYMNSDGSMASNTTVNGYTIGSNGAWIG